MTPLPAHVAWPPARPPFWPAPPLAGLVLGLPCPQPGFRHHCNECMQTRPHIHAFQHLLFATLFTHTVAVYTQWPQLSHCQPYSHQQQTHSGPSTMYAGRRDEPMQLQCVGFLCSHATTTPATDCLLKIKTNRWVVLLCGD